MRSLSVFVMALWLAAPIQAQEDLEAACHGGDASACNNFGHDLEHGDGVVKDMLRAKHFYELACALREPYSCTNVGLFLKDGRAGVTDPGAALWYLKRGCFGGDPKGCAWVADLRRNNEELKAPKLAAEFALHGCELDDPGSCIWYGIAHEDGAGVTLDLKSALKFYERACDLEDGMGCYNASLVLNAPKGWVFGVGRYERAVNLAKRGCSLDHLEACNSVGYALDVGQGVMKDRVAARALFEQTCVAGSGLGCSNLSRLVGAGNGGPKDADLAAELLQKACGLGYEKAC